MTSSESFEKITKQRRKVSKGAATQTNSGKAKRKLKGQRHVAEKKYKGRVRQPKKLKVSKRVKNLLDGIPS